MIPLPRAAKPLVMAAGHLLALWMRSWRVRVCEPDGRVVPLRRHPFGAEIYAFSERDLLAALCVGRWTGFHALVADGNDGDWAIALLAPFDGHYTRGSSLRDGLVALRGLIRELRESRLPLAMAVDGPLGPVGVAREGVVACAAHSGRPIVPVRADASPRITFVRSWARHYLPLPFARVEFRLGAPVHVAPGVRREEMARIARELFA